MRALVVDPDTEQLDRLSQAVRLEGYTVVSALDGQEALVRWRRDRPDIVLLDVNLPRLDGFEVCRRIRHESNTPIIIITARSDEADILRGLRVGADDYVTKPFSPKQLAARMAAVLRRFQERAQSRAANQVQVGHLTLDAQSHEVAVAGRAVHLTRLEFRILYVLALNAGRVVPYSQLVEYGWGDFDEEKSNLPKTHVTNLRRKLGLRTRGPLAIRSVHGVGYTLTPPAVARAG